MATVNCTDTSGLVTLSGTTVDTVNLNAGPFDVCNWTGATSLTVTGHDHAGFARSHPGSVKALEPSLRSRITSR